MIVARIGLLALLLLAAVVQADDDAAKEKEAFTGSAGVSRPVAQAEKEKDEGFRLLFNGSDLTGWEGAEKEASACWLVDGADLVCTGKPGPWLRSTEQFGDYELRLEYKLKEGGNSGVYIRVPKNGNHHGDGAGIEVQVLDDNAARYKELKAYQYTGSLYAIVAAEPRVSKPAGEWNSLTIRCEGTKYEVHHNGQQVIKSDETAAPELGKRLTKGYLGLQNHNEEVRFRNLRIKPLSAPEDKAPPEEKKE